MRARISGDHPLSTPLGAPVVLAIEAGAQAAAAFEALTRRQVSDLRAPQRGQLVRVRQATFSRPYIPLDTELLVTATLLGRAAPLGIYLISLAVGQDQLATATLSTHAPGQ